MQYVTRQESSQTYCSVRVVANIIMRPAWRLVPRPSSGQDGSVQSVKYARHAGVSILKNQPVISADTVSECGIIFTVCKNIYILIFTFFFHFFIENQGKIPKCWYVMPVIRATTPSVSSQLWSPFPLTLGSVE